MSSEAGTPAPAPVASALVEALTLDPAAVFKACGIAAVRRAAAVPAGRLAWRDEGAVLVLELPELGQVCRYVAGAGVAGMVSEAPRAERAAVHLIALAALWREHELAFAWPAGVQAAQAPATEDASSAVPGERERQFLHQVQELLHGLLVGGLAHVSELASGHLLALNMSARGEGLPRLAALLRQLGGTVDLLVRRDHRAEEGDALVLMARIHALCEALLHAGPEPELLVALRGRLRASFDEAATLELLPLGAHWWQTRGGARGLTVAFWDVGAHRLLQALLARPDGNDPGFTRHKVWSAQALWTGAGTVERLCAGGALALQAPRLSDDDRLALGGSTRAEALPAWRADDPRLAGLGIDDWSQLAARLRAATGLAGEPFDAVLLRPAAVAPPVLDEARQQLDWPVRDAAGRWLRLSIACGPEHELRIANLDRLVARGAPVHAVLVQVERQEVAVQWVPVAVLTTGEARQLVALSLDFADEPARAGPLVQRLRRLFEGRRVTPPVLPGPSLVKRLLQPVQDVSEAQAATGRMVLTALQRQTLAEALPRIAAIGLHTVTAALDAHLQAPSPAGLLRLVALCQRVAQLEAVPQISVADTKH